MIKSLLLFVSPFPDFDGDGEPDNIGFMIKRIKVHSKDAVKEDPQYRFPGNYGVEKFLEIFSGRSVHFGTGLIAPLLNERF